MKRKSKFIALCLGFLICQCFYLVGVSYVQGALAQKEVEHVLSSVIDEPIEREGHIYHPISYEGLAALMWKYDVHTTENYDALLQYIILAHCQVYGTYVKNDFSWNRILESKKRELNYFRSNVNARYALSDVITLSRFDFQHNMFHLNSQSIMKNMGIIKLFDMHNLTLSPCARNYSRKLSKYPKAVSLKLENPLSIRSFPIDPKGARELIEGFETNNDGDRIMFSRLYVRITDVDDYSIKGSVRDYVRFLGRLERFEIYSDIQAQNLVFLKDFR